MADALEAALANITKMATMNNWTHVELDEALAGLELHRAETVSPDAQALVITMYSLTALLSLIGNSLVIVILSFGKRWVRTIANLLFNFDLFVYKSYLTGNEYYLYSTKLIQNELYFTKSWNISRATSKFNDSMSMGSYQHCLVANYI